MKKGATIYLAGIVQGVGFRPFVYREAIKKQLNGFVTNLGDATVKIRVEGEEKQIKEFIKGLKQNAPAVSKTTKMQLNWRAYTGRFKKFEIKISQIKRELFGSTLPPDIAICDKCMSDILNPKSRWYNYPFTCCSHCGPRFTATYTLPYDRIRTNMNSFPFCEKCKKEYKNPLDRRFHAQGICCPECGPQIRLYKPNGEIIITEDPIKEAAELIDEGNIVAIKGIGGTHLAAKTTEDAPLENLRRRKRRPAQPFAVMSLNINIVKKYAEISKDEELELTSWQKPILLLQKSVNYHLSELVAPKLSTIGVMLPYTGIHLLLLNNTSEPAIVMTSGNKPGLPMATTNKQAFKTLNGIADYLLLHNRKIVSRCDDSVACVINGKTTFIRRSRGYIPTPINTPTSSNNNIIIALGAELRNTGAILYKDKCYLTQYIGDTDNLETIDYLNQALSHMRSLLKITGDPSVIACDLHPQYLTSRLAQEKSQQTKTKLIKVQHHHAHIASLMAENSIAPDQSIIGIAMDGIGYGPDGTIWGGEILETSYLTYKRLGHLKTQPMPGGDLCTKYPLRMLIAILSTVISERDIRHITSRHITSGLPRGQKELDLILNQLTETSLVTSSTGRVLDALSALTGLCYERTYEGEPAIKLEAVASQGNPLKIELSPKIDHKNGLYVLDTSDLVHKIMISLKNHRIPDVCAASQQALASGMAEMAILAALDRGLYIVGLSGGVAVNRNIVKVIKTSVENQGLKFISHSAIPPGDGGISIGQAIVALFTCDM